MGRLNAIICITIVLTHSSFQSVTEILPFVLRRVLMSMKL